ncbi:hypothetical protein J6590_066822 [Homalodisca vitripennis]|nr:hypothetical protein J6590_066822 [Homalodisca vitripennis]
MSRKKHRFASTTRTLYIVRPRRDKRKTDARPQLYALAAQTKRETSLTLRPDFHELLLNNAHCLRPVCDQE